MSSSKTVWSFFSGAMGLDLGLEAAGLQPSLVVEKDPTCLETITRNRPSVLIPSSAGARGDITRLTGYSLRRESGFDDDVFLMVGGPPCQSFSSGGKRAGLSDPRGNLIYHYLRLVGEVQPRYFLLENVANLVTAALSHRPIKERPGRHWSLKKYDRGASRAASDGNPALRPDELSGSAIRQILFDMSELGYRLRFGVLNAADFGAAQKRLRFIMMGSREGNPPALPIPSHGGDSALKPFATLRDVIWDLRDDPGPHSVYTEDVARFFRLVPPGGSWRDLPQDLQPEALGGSYTSGGGKTGFFRRLSWDRPAPTLTGRANRKGSAICHPDEVRPLSVRECSRLQGFPDSWDFAGSMSSQYLQIGNAVPTQLGAAVGHALLQSHYVGRAPACDAWEAQLEVAVRTLRASARNSRARGRPTNRRPADAAAPQQMSLFESSTAAGVGA